MITGFHTQHFQKKVVQPLNHLLVTISLKAEMTTSLWIAKWRKSLPSLDKTLSHSKAFDVLFSSLVYIWRRMSRFVKNSWLEVNFLVSLAFCMNQFSIWIEEMTESCTGRHSKQAQHSAATRYLPNMVLHTTHASVLSTILHNSYLPRTVGMTWLAPDLSHVTWSNLTV